MAAFSEFSFIRSPISLKWKIAKENLLQIGNLNLESDSLLPFEDSNAEYRLYIYPGIQSESDRSKYEVWIFLGVRPGFEKRVQVEYSITVESEKFSHSYAKDTISARGFWGTYLCERKDFFDPNRNYFVNDIFTIKLEGIMKIERSNYEVNCYGNGDLGDQLWERDDKDFTIVVEGKEIKVHKLILATRSPVFSRMFKTEMQEAAENKVIIKDFPYDIVEIAIFMCYQKQCTVPFSIDDYMFLLQFFDKYNMQSFKDKLENDIIPQICASNVCRLLHCSTVCNSPKINAECKEYLKKCFEQKIPVSDLDLIDKEMALILLKNTFNFVCETV